MSKRLSCIAAFLLLGLLEAASGCITPHASPTAINAATTASSTLHLDASEATAIIERTLLNGGCTFDLRTRQFIAGTPAIAVALKGGELVKADTNETALQKALRQFLESRTTAFSDPRAKLGTWRTPSGDIALDVTILIPYSAQTYKAALAEAQHLGRLHQQDALYDLGQGREIPVEK